MAETKCYEQTATPILHLPVVLGGEMVEKLGVKLSLGKRERWGQGVFDFALISHYPTV